MATAYDIPAAEAPFLAIKYGKAECLQNLFDNGTKVDVTGPNGRTLVHAASYYAKPECLRILVAPNAKLDVNDDDDGFTALEQVGKTKKKASRKDVKLCRKILTEEKK